MIAVAVGSRTPIQSPRPSAFPQRASLPFDASVISPMPSAPEQGAEQ